MIYREIEELSHLFDTIWDVLSPLTEEERDNVHLDGPVGSKIEKIRKDFGRYTQNKNHQNDSPPQFPSLYETTFGYNQIYPSQITLYKMDAATRVYAYLHELFPKQYAISMPANFEHEDIYKKSNPRIIYFDWSITDKETAKKAFIESAIRVFARQMTWANSEISIKKSLAKGNVLINLFKMGVLTKNPEVDCSDENLNESVRSQNCIKIKPKDIISHFRSIIDFMNIDDRDRELLLLLGKEEKYGQLYYEKLIKKKDEHELYSIYDLIFKRIFSDNSVTSSESLWFFDHLVQYVQSAQNIDGSSFIFPVPDYINEIFIKKYSQFLINYYQYNKEFLLEIKDQIKDAESISYTYRLDQVHTLNEGTNKLSQNSDISLEPLVSDLMYGKFESLVRKLDDKTSGIFSNILESYLDEITNIVEDDEDGEEDKEEEE